MHGDFGVHGLPAGEGSAASSADGAGCETGFGSAGSTGKEKVAFSTSREIVQYMINRDHSS